MMIKEYDALHKQEERTKKKRESFYYGLLEYLKKNLLDIIGKEYSSDFNAGNGYEIDLFYTKEECPLKVLRIYKDSKIIVRVHEVSKENNQYHHDEPFLNIQDEDIVAVKEFANQLPSLLNETLEKKYEDEKYKADEKEALYEMLYRQSI